MNAQTALFDPPFEHLTIDATPAMRRGDQTVWQCSWCGCIVVSPSGQPVSGSCPAPACAGPRPREAYVTPWWQQRLPVAGVREADPLDRDQLILWLEQLAAFYDRIAESCASFEGANASEDFRHLAAAARALEHRVRSFDLDRPRSLHLSESSEP